MGGVDFWDLDVDATGHGRGGEVRSDREERARSPPVEYVDEREFDLAGSKGLGNHTYTQAHAKLVEKRKRAHSRKKLPKVVAGSLVHPWGKGRRA
eukprot:CAMPEP_0182888586 /NCGR_PEP_ID=MMETSP0034_2-20130328/21521_1 /TAXON_ID=156128 /ORGANISM="Nephroselmis pyriformis, Strain CCMP717" /LENGTH=94 /DNA_ID=CAMNT_0025022023 /DNA_START=174 /DNA_END=454 /DNA_ORIENTATION=+